MYMLKCRLVNWNVRHRVKFPLVIPGLYSFGSNRRKQKKMDRNWEGLHGFVLQNVFKRFLLLLALNNTTLA